MTTQDVCFTSIVRVNNTTYLRRHAAVRGIDASQMSIPELLPLLLINPLRPALQSGYEVLDSFVQSIERGNVYHLAVETRVYDAQLLCHEASERYASCWFEENWEPGCLAQAAYEVLLGSNANPTRQDMGFEITSTHLQTALAPSAA